MTAISLPAGGHPQPRPAGTTQSPPRIPEPGPWGVVKASYGGFPPCIWHHDEFDLWRSTGGFGVDWDTLIDPVLIRAGVSS